MSKKNWRDFVRAVLLARVAAAQQPIAYRQLMDARERAELAMQQLERIAQQLKEIHDER